MTNTLVGDVYEKIIQGTVDKSATAFEEYGVSGATLLELQQEWQAKLSQRGMATMPWDPKPAPQPAAVPAPPSAVANGITPSYAYDTPPSATNASRVKQESNVDNQYAGLPNGYGPQGTMPPQGGAARAAALMQHQYGAAATSSINAMRSGGGGLALPGNQQAKPQGLSLPAQSPPNNQQYSPQQQQAFRQQQQQLQQQQAQPRIKVENDSPHLGQGSFPQQNAQPNYSQTDGADDDSYGQWKAMLAQRRALHAEQGDQADHLMRDQVLQNSAELQSGLMMPLDELPSNKRVKRSKGSHNYPASTSRSSIPQFDGVADDEDEEKTDIKDEEDSDAINSGLDDPDDKADDLGDDDDDGVDTILCTYDKVQRVKNKWKCTLKDGIMSSGGKEWVFAKGMGEFEW